jgi:hypothetical protein
MLKQWSKNVLQKWIDVYTLLIPKLMTITPDSYDKLEKECIDTGLKMLEKTQPISVRINSAYFLA